jgi:hypothetical protein
VFHSLLLVSSKVVLLLCFAGRRAQHGIAGKRRAEWFDRSQRAAERRKSQV